MLTTLLGYSISVYLYDFLKKKTYIYIYTHIYIFVHLIYINKIKIPKDFILKVTTSKSPFHKVSKVEMAIKIKIHLLNVKLVRAVL